MNSEQKAVTALSILVLVEYTLGGLVTFSDPSDTGFQLLSFTASWPGILPTVHRLFAVILIVLWIPLSLPLRGSRALILSHMTLGLIVIQAIIGIFIPVTAGSQLNSYIIIIHFSVSALIIAAVGFTAVRAWLGTGPGGTQRVHTPPEGQ